MSIDGHDDATIPLFPEQPTITIGRLQPRGNTMQSPRGGMKSFADKRTQDLITRLLDYHRPTPEMQPRFQDVTGMMLAVGDCINDHVPPGPDKTYCIRKLSELRMAINQAIACNPAINPNVPQPDHA